MLWQFCKFISVGSCTTAAQYLLLTFLVEVYGLRATVASTIGFVISATISYILNRRFTFHSAAKHRIAIPMFMTVALTGMTLNAAVIGWLQAHTTVHYILAQICASSVVLIWNFTTNSVWTFKAVLHVRAPIDTKSSDVGNSL